MKFSFCLSGISESVFCIFPNQILVENHRRSALTSFFKEGEPNKKNLRPYLQGLWTMVSVFLCVGVFGVCGGFGCLLCFLFLLCVCVRCCWLRCVFGCFCAF